ncbi:hypothetical protein HDV01_004948 [Terramyces sp. JEL0728]|nr:hypothetical protein HDV01_004948 [Terramyces sp. JEL0728]
MSFTQKIGGLFGGKKQTNAPLPPTPNGNINLITPELAQYRRDEDEINNHINQYTEKLHQETTVLQSAEQIARAHTDPTSILKAQEEIEYARHRVSQLTNELYKFLKHMQELSQIRRKGELDILWGIMAPTEVPPQDITQLQHIEGQIKIAINDFETQLKQQVESRENAIRVLNSGQAPDRNVPITSFGYIPHVASQGTPQQFQQQQQPQQAQQQQQFQQPQQSQQQQFQQPQQAQQQQQQFQPQFGSQASSPVTSNPQIKDSPIPGNTIPRSAIPEPVNQSPAHMAQQAFGQPQPLQQNAPVQNKLDIKMETIRDFPNGIPKEEYVRAINERNKYADMCQLFSADMMRNGIDSMYITVADQLTAAREEARTSQSTISTLENQVATLKDEIDRLKKTTAAPIPAPVVSQKKESDEWKIKWQNQLESKIAFLQVRLQNPPSADSKSLMEKEMWINQEMLDSLKVQIEKEIVKLAKQDYERLKKEVVESKEDVAILEEEAAKFAEIQENLETQVQLQKVDIQKLKADAKSAEAAPPVTGSLEELQLKERELQAQVDTLANENSILHKQKLGLESKIATIESSSGAPTSPVVSSKDLISTNLLESEIRKLNLKVSTLSSDLAAASGWEATASKLTKEVDDLTNERNAMQSQLFVVKAQYKQASKKVETLSESVRELQTSFAHYKSESERLKEELEIAMNQPPANVAEFDTLLAERDQLASSLNETKIALAGLQSKYQIEVANVASLKKTLQELTE